MRILITNDDGYDAPGLLALYQALQPLGEIVVVAPAKQHSSQGHAVAMRPFKVRKQEIEGIGSGYVVDSTPADCVRVGLTSLFDQPIDYVVSGINPGGNLGVDANYSGTIAAAREAAILEVPAIAVSQYMHSTVPLDWSVASTRAFQSVATLLEQPMGIREFWNVNLPAVAGEDSPMPLAFVPMCTLAHETKFEAETTPDGAQQFRLRGEYQARGVTPGSDVEHVFAGHITATRMQLDQTSRTFPASD